MESPMRIAVIVGAAGGIGAAISIELAAKGVSLLLVDRDDVGLDALLRKLPGDTHRAVPVDLEDAAAVEDMAADLPEIDILVYSAGWLRHGPLSGSLAVDAQRAFAVNTLAPIALCRMLAPRMAARGAGDIVLITSALARDVFAGTTIYSATKHGLAALAKGLRLEFSQQGVRVTEVSPGLVEGTRLLDNTDDTAFLAGVATRSYTPITPNDVAEAVIFVVSRPSGVEVGRLDIRPLGQA